MISLNATIFVQVAFFLVLVFVLNRLMIQPIHRVILQRDEAIRERELGLDAASEELRKMAQAYESRLRAAEADAQAARKALRERASREAHEAFATAQEEVAELRRKAREQALQELEKARKDLKKQAEALSFEITTKVVGRRV
ncbi:ATP synthase B/B' CF(0) [Desulfacinum hydrothermale DSM 13146]|uniref:ATP synthase subunit b n=1 Tax=Desulfacinum hydrothermale DSM 13146 TaxID=1121390 RepID=A0A1W1WZN0_9BACT|nr:ATP synthase F0 subunit B [Desulfacinum hydrothermale]SMC16898.1 ATP synthase B/B' CF(0) [Desulfacinum hydrothermale DSM 13146]